MLRPLWNVLPALDRSVRIFSTSPDRDARFSEEASAAEQTVASSLRRRVREGLPRQREAVVLVVDDDPDHRAMMREALEDEGYSVETAEHGADGLARLRAGSRPDLIVLDLRMPVLDGWGFMAELKRDPDLAPIPIVVTTQAGDRVLASAPVSAAYLAKPFEAHRLIETVRACLARRRRS
jgi:CheY-like chemotaxis protein